MGASSVKNEADDDLGEDAFQERRHSGRRRKVVKSHYKEDSDFEMDDDEDGDADIANSSSDEDTKPEKPKTRKRSDHTLNSSDSVVQFNDYSGSRKDFWSENFVKTTLKAVQKQEMKMIEAARLLGVTYSILYSKYREAFGKIGYKSDQSKCTDSKEESKDVQSVDKDETPRKRKGQ